VDCTTQYEVKHGGDQATVNECRTFCNYDTRVTSSDRHDPHDMALWHVAPCPIALNDMNTHICNSDTRMISSDRYDPHGMALWHDAPFPKLRMI